MEKQFKGFLTICILLSIGVTVSANSLPGLSIPNNFGVSIHFTANPRFEEIRHAADKSSYFETGSYLTNHDQELDMIAEAGLKFIRVDMTWSLVERKKGVYDFEGPGYDGLTEGCFKRGIGMIYVLSYSNKLYESNMSVVTDKGRKAFAAFARAAVNRYKGKGVLWEIWNEPNIEIFWKPEPNAAEYCRLVETTAEAIKQADPSAIVLGPSISGWHERPWFEWLEESFKNGLLEWVDALTVHPYRRKAEPPENLIAEYAKIRKLVSKYVPKGKDMPVLCGECGYSMANRFPEKRQAENFVRMCLVNLYQEVPVTIWYDWRDDGSDPNFNEHNFGITRLNLEPKMSYIAAKTLNNTLNGYSIKKRLDVGNENDFALLLEKNGEQALAFWTIDQPHEIEFQLGPGKAKLVKMLGNWIDLSWKSKQISLFVSQSPQYLLIQTDSPF